METGFNEIREAYINARAEERTTLVEVLTDNGFEVKNRGSAGSGIKNYGKAKLSPAHDLRHHKWIEAKRDGVSFLISLNPYEVDASTGNPHHLYDRIGVQAYLGDNTEAAIRTAMIITKWSLPFTEEIKRELLLFLEKLIRMFDVWK